MGSTALLVSAVAISVHKKVRGLVFVFSASSVGNGMWTVIMPYCKYGFAELTKLPGASYEGLIIFGFSRPLLNRICQIYAQFSFFCCALYH